MDLDIIRVIDKFFGNIFSVFFIILISIKKKIVKSNDVNQIKKILIVRFFGFGNLVLAFPTIKKISELFPDAEIHLLTINKNKQLHEALDVVDKTIFINVDSFFAFFSSFYKVFSCLRKEKYDLAVDFEVFAYISAFLLCILGIKKRVGYNLTGYKRGALYTTAIEYNNNQHITKSFYDLAIALGAKKKEHVELDELHVSEADKLVVENFFRDNDISKKNKIVGMHAGSGQNFVNRRWSEKNLAKIADYLIDRFNTTIILTGTRSEKFLMDNTLKEMKSDKSKVVFADNLTISQMAFFLKKLDLYFCSDTGPLHLAVAMNVPTVSFFGPNTPLLYGPPANDERHMFFYENISCSPCITNFNAKMSKCQDPKCLSKITVEKVIAYLDEYLEKCFT